MADRPSRPHASPRRTPARTERRIIRLRVSKRFGPARIAARLGMHASTVHAVLARYGCPPLASLNQGSGARIRRYERKRPGELVHAAAGSSATSPTEDAGGPPDGSRAARTAGPAPAPARQPPGHRLQLPAHRLDDCSRLAYTEILPDERKKLPPRSWSALELSARPSRSACSVHFPISPVGTASSSMPRVRSAVR